MTKRLNIPLVSDVPPDPSYTAGQVLHRVMSALPAVQFDFYWVNHSHLPAQFTAANNCAIARVFGFELHGVWLRISQLVGRLGRRSSVMRRVAVLMRIAMWTGKSLLVGYRLGRALKKTPSELVWCVVQGEKTVLAYSVAELISRKKLILHQWDPLSWWMTHRGYPSRIHAPVRWLLDRLERKAALNIVPSDAWKEALVAQGKKCIRLDNFFDDPSDSDVAPVFLKDNNAVHAVFVGQFYSNAELDQLIAKLCQALHHRRRRLVVHYFGAGIADFSSKGYELVSHGVLPRDVLVERISKWDVALLPYPTEHRFLEASSLSFPSKSRVYLAAGLPIVSWTLEGSSPDRFYRKEYSDSYHNALTENEMEGFLEKIVNGSPSQRRERYLGARALLGRQFSFSSELVPFSKFMSKEA